jgi:hypothetical protein
MFIVTEEFNNNVRLEIIERNSVKENYELVVGGKSSRDVNSGKFGMRNGHLLNLFKSAVN